MIDLSRLNLPQLPSEIGRLGSLQTLDLSNNQLSQLPPEIGQLGSLKMLDLENNQLSQLPPEIGQLGRLKTLDLEYNPVLLTPPPEIVIRGTSAILDFLQGLQKDSSIRYEVKLLVVGEGGTGKSSLLKSLRNEAFDQQLSSTHGIEVNRLNLQHPYRPDSEIILNTWDFGGQHIYHATHQFFLTKRSLFLVVWNARLGGEQGRLHFWLETIKALAPDAPVLLVATHTDIHAPDINYHSYQEEYPQLVGSFSVSNKDGSGLHELEEGLAHYAVEIRLMGQPWPRRWLEIEQQLPTRASHRFAYIYRILRQQESGCRYCYGNAWQLLA
jgi:GTPase SAR1 family protein